MIDVAAIVAKIPDPGLSSLDFFNFLAVEFRMNKKFDSKGAFLIYLKHFLHRAHANRKRVLLIIDEAQRLNHELLEQIRLLSNIELQNRKLINIFFVGQTEFGEMLMEDRNRAVRQRITVSYHIEPLTESEAGEYVRHRLKVAGATKEIFSKDAIREIFSFANGYPRLMNIICDHALLTGYASGLKSIDKKVIQECKRELQIPLEGSADKGKESKTSASNPIPASNSSPEKTSWFAKFVVAAAVIMLLAFGVYYFAGEKSATAPRWSMEEIAPQEYKGPLPKDLKASNSPGLQVAELHEVQPVQEESLEQNAVKKEIQPPADDNASNRPNPSPAEKVPPTAMVQQTAPVIPPEASSAAHEVMPVPERKTIINFKYNSNELPPESFETLDRIADFLKRNPAAGIDIKGYTDSSGSRSYNISVSEFRANTIKTYLVGKGVSAARITAAGLGPENPLAKNDTEEGRRKNRRVEIELNIQN
jgi:general secretion pathway protein A